MKLLYFIFVIQYFAVFGQNPYSVRYGIDEGLPTSNIYCAFEDKDGYIWFGTDVGILKYDGYTFKQFSVDDGLSDNEVFKLYQDEEGRLWFLTLNGQLSYYQHGRFYNTKNNSLLKEASHQKILIDIYETNGNHIFLYRDGTEITLNIANESIHRNKYNHSLFGHWEIDNRFYYLGFDAVLNITENKTFVFEELADPSKNYRLTTHNNSSYFSIFSYLYEFTNDSVTFVQDLNSEVIYLTSIDKNLWLGTRNGLIVKSKSSNIHYFKQDAVSHIIKDSQSNYWVTTLNNGIRFIPNLDIQEFQLSEKKIKVNDVIATSTEVFAGTENGLFKLEEDRKSQNFRLTQINNDYIKRLRLYNNNLISIGNETIKMYENNKVFNYPFGANDCFFNGSNYYFSSSVVFRFSDTEMTNLRSLSGINSLKKEELENKTLLKKRTNIIYPLKPNSILLGTSSGLYSYETNNLKPLYNTIESLNASIKDIIKDSETNNLFVATNSKGISVLKNGSLLHHITKKQNLSSNTCNSIELFGNNIIAGTNVGVDYIVLTDSTYQIENLNAKIGLRKEKINNVSLRDSLVFIGTDKGLISYNLRSKNKKIIKPKLVIETVLINDSLISDLSNLKSSQNNIAVNFVGISYADFGSINYQYRINRTNWIDLDASNLVIKNLSSGNYQIDLRAKGNQSIWSDIESIKFYIHPPFYKTAPFILLLVISLFLLINFFIGKRIKSLKQTFNKERKILRDKQQKAEIEKQMLDLEQKALRMQMNPHFIFNALNTIKGYYSVGNIKEANTYIGELSKLLRLILENDERLIPIEKEIKIITLYIKLIQLRYVNVFEYHIHVDSKINVSEIGIPTLILQPLVENAIIHGLAPMNKKGTLKISFEIVVDQLICKVIDDGIGYSKALKKSDHKNENTSKALKITKDRIDIENKNSSEQNFEIKDGENNIGTEVIIKLPILKVW